jgi:hypothetical protein
MVLKLEDHLEEPPVEVLPQEPLVQLLLYCCCVVFIGGVGAREAKNELLLITRPEKPRRSANELFQTQTI